LAALATLADMANSAGTCLEMLMTCPKPTCEITSTTPGDVGGLGDLGDRGDLGGIVDSQHVAQIDSAHVCQFQLAYMAELADNQPPVNDRPERQLKPMPKEEWDADVRGLSG
jgi:hypothetical protein